MTFLLFIGFLILLFAHLNLRHRVDMLEGSLTQKEASTPLSQSSEVATAPVSLVASSSVLDQPIQALDWWPRFVSWMQEDWLLKLGALLLIIGFGWFVSYAFLNNWIGPMGRIMLGLIGGAAFLLLGFLRLQRFVQQGSVFLVLGATTILLTMYAARAVYDFFTPFSAMALMFLTAAFVAFASVWYRLRSLAFAGIILAGVAPLLVKPPTPDYVGLFGYLFVVVLGILWVVTFTGWRNLLVAALTMVTLYSAPHWSVFWRLPSAELKTLTYISFGLVIVFFVSNLLAFLKKKEMGDSALPEGRLSVSADLVSAVWIGAFLIPWVFTGIDRELQSLVLSAWAALFTLGAFVVFTQTGNRKPLFAYAAVGVLLLGVATARELDGAVLTIALTLEAATLTFLTYMLLRDRIVAIKISLLFIVPAALSLESIARYPVHESTRYGTNYYGGVHPTSIFHEHFFVLLLLAITLFALGSIFTRLQPRPSEETPHATFPTVLLIVGSLYAFVLLWLSLHEVFPEDSATMTALVVYTFIGLFAHLYGRTNDLRGLRLAGGALLGFVVARLLFVEVWNMELTERIFTFFVIGTLLVITAFLGKKRTNAEEISSSTS